MNIFNNLTILLFIILGYTILAWHSIFVLVSSINLSFATITAIYYLLLSILFKRFKFSAFILITFFILILFLTYVYKSSITFNNIYLILCTNYIVVYMYSFILVPFVFFSWTADIYSLPHEVNRLWSNRTIHFIIPILIKRELIRHRFKKITESLYSRGIDTIHKPKIFTIFHWIIPLGVTTIQEGLESHDYNQMLRTNIKYMKHKAQNYYVSAWQKCLIVFILFMLTVRIVLWINI